MLQKLDLENDQVLAFKWEGEFDKAAFDQAMTKFLPELKLREHFNLYIEMHGIGKVEAKAVWEDLKFSIKNMKELTDKIERIALVSDQTWMKNLAEATYALIPGIKLKSFSFLDRDKAILWVTE